MRTIQREETKPVRPLRTEPEQPVFVAQTGRRAQRLRKVALAAAALVCLWLAGLAVGMLGFDALPGASLPGIDRLRGGGRDEAPRDEQREPLRPAADVPDGSRAGSEEGGASFQARRQPSRSVRTDRTAPPPRTVRPAPTTQGAQTQPLPVAPPPRGQGWTRRGLTVPPGQTHKTQTTPPPPPGTRGQRRGQQTTTSTTPPPPPGNGQGQVAGPKQR
jgi:hypothetical protein